jgi:hypothetical protein
MPPLDTAVIVLAGIALLAAFIKVLPVSFTRLPTLRSINAVKSYSSAVYIYRIPANHGSLAD